MSSLPLSDWKVDTTSPVLVTGATGYVAGVLIRELLELGVTVHAAVWDPSDAIKGCTVVFHTASPFIFGVKDPQKDLVDPAIQGTRNMLNEATKTKTVRRVVLTSSCLAVYADARDTYKAANNILTEDVWNTTASLHYQPYGYSKTLAEQTAWVIAGSQNQWTLVTINPGLVMGPGTKYHATSESFSTIKRLATDMASGCPNICWGVVDVREVAHAHVVAGFNEHAQGRHILNARNTGLWEMAECLREKYPSYPLPARTISKYILWPIAPYVGLSRSFVWNNVDVPINLDNTKSKRELGIVYRPLVETMQDMMQQLIDEGVLEKK